MTIQAPRDQYSEVVNQDRRWTPDWYSWLTGLVSDITKTFVSKIGDTMTGDLTISKNSPSLILNDTLPANTTGVNNLFGQRNALNRWLIQLGNAVAETGGNIGSHFAIYRYSDAGALIDSPFSINRTNGTTSMSGLSVFGPGNDPVLISAAGGYSRIQYVSQGVRQWSAGVWADAYFRITDESGGAVILAVGYVGANSVFTYGLTVGGNLAVNGGGTNTFAGEFTTSTFYGINYSTFSPNHFGFTYNDIGAGLASIYIDRAVAYAIANASDKRLKQDIAPSTFDCLAAVNQLQVCEYRWMDQSKPGKPAPVSEDKATLIHAGLIAQDVYDIAWWLVKKPQAEPEGTIHAWDLDQNNLIATLVGAVKQLTQRVEALEGR